jgi:branched-chain amino acid transport system permease protein
VSFFLQQLINGLALGTTYSLIALGFVLVFGVMKVFNAALGGLVVLGAYAAWFVSSHSTPNIVVALAVALVVTMAAGFVVERVAIAPVAGRNQLASFLTTLGCAILIEGVLRTYFTAQPQAFRVSFPSAVIEVGGLSVGLRQLCVIALAGVLIVACDQVITKTAVGRRLRAVAEDPPMATSLGINARRVRLLTVAAASALAAVTGVLLGVSYGSITPTMGLGLMLKGFIILSVGGMTSFRGAALVGVLLGVAEVMTTAYAPELPRDAFTYGLLVLVMLARPAGLFGRRSAIPTSTRMTA